MRKESNQNNQPNQPRMARLRLPSFERSTKKMALRRFSILLVLPFVCTFSRGSDLSDEWDQYFGEDAAEVWKFCSTKGEFFPSRLLMMFRQMGSQNDGDRQYEVARLLSTVEVDPFNSLKHFIFSPDPYDRAFAIQVVAHLKDLRFRDLLSSLESDSASVSDWEMVSYKTVGEAAIYALAAFDKETDSLSSLEIRDWLVRARSSAQSNQVEQGA